MWLTDPHGVNLEGADEAREELRRRAQLAIGAGLKAGQDIRALRVRIRDERGNVTFVGTLAEAAASELRTPDLPLPLRHALILDEVRRARRETAELRIQFRAQKLLFEELCTRVVHEVELARELVRKARALMRETAPHDAELRSPTDVKFGIDRSLPRLGRSSPRGAAIAATRVAEERALVEPPSRL